MTSIIGYTDLMLHHSPPEATREKWLKYIFDSGQRLDAMVNDLLNVSRIQSGRVNVKLTPVNLTDIVNEILSLTSGSTDKHQFVVNIKSDFPAVVADRDKLSQIIGNLLSNAIKYSPNGGKVTIAAEYNDVEHRAIISVSDEGIGISPEDERSLFTTFHRIQRPETQGIRGSGLGLYIAKEWAEAMGGEIWVRSELNKGSTFFVGIPV